LKHIIFVGILYHEVALQRINFKTHITQAQETKQIFSMPAVS